MPITVSTTHVDFHFAFDVTTKHLVVLFDESFQGGRGRVFLRPYDVECWPTYGDDHRLISYTLTTHDQVLEEFWKIKPYLSEIRYHLKTVIQKELFENEL